MFACSSIQCAGAILRREKGKRAICLENQLILRPSHFIQFIMYYILYMLLISILFMQKTIQNILKNKQK